MKMNIKTMDRTNWNANDTMRLVGKLTVVDCDSEEGQAIDDIMSAYGFDNHIALLSPSDLRWFCTHIMSMGIRYGVAKERARRRNGKKNTNR